MGRTTHREVTIECGRMHFTALTKTLAREQLERAAEEAFTGSYQPHQITIKGWTGIMWRDAGAEGWAMGILIAPDEFDGEVRSFDKICTGMGSDRSAASVGYSMIRHIADCALGKPDADADPRAIYNILKPAVTKSCCRLSCIIERSKGDRWLHDIAYDIASMGKSRAKMLAENKPDLTMRETA